MAIRGVYATIAVSDLGMAKAWYIRLLGAPAEPPHSPITAEWSVAGDSWIQLVLDPARAGRSMVTLAVDDVEVQIALLHEHGLSIVEGGPGDLDFRLAQIGDLDGNLITFSEDVRQGQDMDDAHVGAASDEASISIG